MSFYDVVTEAVLEPPGWRPRYPALDDVIPDIAIGTCLRPTTIQVVPRGPTCTRSPPVASRTAGRLHGGGLRALPGRVPESRLVAPPGATTCSGRASAMGAKRRPTARLVGVRRGPRHSVGTRAEIRGTWPECAGTRRPQFGWWSSQPVEPRGAGGRAQRTSCSSGSRWAGHGSRRPPRDRRAPVAARPAACGPHAPCCHLRPPAAPRAVARPPPPPGGAHLALSATSAAQPATTRRAGPPGPPGGHHAPCRPTWAARRPTCRPPATTVLRRPIAGVAVARDPSGRAHRPSIHVRRRMVRPADPGARWPSRRTRRFAVRPAATRGRAPGPRVAATARRARWRLPPRVPPGARAARIPRRDRLAEQHDDPRRIAPARAATPFEPTSSDSSSASASPS